MQTLDREIERWETYNDPALLYHAVKVSLSSAIGDFHTIRIALIELNDVAYRQTLHCDPTDRYSKARAKNAVSEYETFKSANQHTLQTLSVRIKLLSKFIDRIAEHVDDPIALMSLDHATLRFRKESPCIDIRSTLVEISNEQDFKNEVQRLFAEDANSLYSDERLGLNYRNNE